MALYGAAKAPAVQDANGQTVAELSGSLTGTVDGTVEDVADIALDTSNTYTDAAVNAAVNAAIAEVNEQLKELQTAYNDLLEHLNDGRVPL